MPEGVKCENCGAPVHGAPGVMACPYCGSRVDIPLDAPPPQRMLPEEDPEERARARRHDSYEEDEEREQRESSSSGGGTVVMVGIFGAILVVFFVGFAASKSRSKKSTKDERKSVAITATTTTSKKATPVPPYVESISIPSCKCAFGDGQSTPLVTLSLKAPPTSDSTRSLQLGISRQSGFVTETTTASLSLASVDGGVLPQHLGVACDTGVYVLVGDKTATGWSSVNASLKWTTTLPAAMVDGADAGAPSPSRSTAFSSYCTPLATQNGNATIALANGRRATLSLKDGKLR